MICQTIRRPTSLTPFPYTTLFRSEESEHRRRRQPRAAMRQLQQAHGSLARAAEHLGRASAGMNAAMESLARAPQDRSEEHTSELQSHVNLVCRLLLEKIKIF